MVSFQDLGGFAQEMLKQVNNQNNDHNSNQQYGSGSPGRQSGDSEDDVKATVSGNLVSLLGGSGSTPAGTSSRGLGSFIGGLTSSASLDERQVNAAHEKAYNQGGAQDMSNQDLGAAAGKEVFDIIFGGGSGGNSGSRDRSVSGGGNGELASDVTQLFGTAATEQQQSGTTDRGFGSNLLSSLSGAAQGAQPKREKDTFEKIVDLISREVAKFMGGNANKNDVAAAATQTFTQLMIKKKIYGFMGKTAPEDNPASTVTNFLGTLGVGGNNNNNSGSGAGGLGGLAAQFLGGGNNSNQQQQQQQSNSSAGGLGGLAAQFLGGNNSNNHSNNNNNNNQQQQQQSNQSQQQSGGFGALAGLAASALGGSKPQQQQGYQQQGQQQGYQQQGQQQSQQQGQQQGGGAPDFSQLLSMAGPMLSALGNKH